MEKILVLDFGGQYTQLIAKAIRKCGVFSEIQDCNYNIGNIIREKPKGIILSGGPASVYLENSPVINEYVLELGIPVLGICYGMQLITHLTGGKVAGGNINKSGEYGKTEMWCTDHALFKGVPDKISVWMSHRDSVEEPLPEGFKAVSHTAHIAAIADDTRKIYGVQFHPEVNHSEFGVEIIRNFLFEICSCSGNWKMKNYIADARAYIRQTVGKNDVISFASGGVDSTFVSALLSSTEGIGNVHVVYIEALMRKNETEEAEAILKGSGVKNLHIYRAKHRFIQALKGITEPEQKRKIIGNLFGTLMTEAVKELNLNPDTTFLAQGTLYTDLIESGKGVGKKASNIKSHHNVGCEFIENLKKAGRVVEPNRMIFKDEVRAAAKELGIPEEFCMRQPFPGPGLAIRIVNGDEMFFDESLEEKIKTATGLSYSTYLVPVKTVGVQGDERTYRNLALISGDKNWEAIRKTAEKITSQTEVNRVVYSLNPVKCSRIHALHTEVDEKSTDLLGRLDAVGCKILKKYGLMNRISQAIFILFGADTGSKKPSAAFRAVCTDDFMTVTPAIPMFADKDQIRENPAISLTWECLDEIAAVFSSDYGIETLVYDVTDKPPATTCWE